MWPVLAGPGAAWMLLLFVLPMYLVLAIAFGRVDPVFNSAIPTWNPLQWNPRQFQFVLGHLIGRNGFLGPAFLRTFIYVGIASTSCLLIA